MSDVFLTDAELVSARADAAVVLPETAEIRRRDSAGAWFTPAGLEAVPCRLSLTLGRGDHRLTDPASATDADARLTLPAGTDIRPTDAAIVDGRRFEVVVVDPTDRIHRQARGKVQ